MLLFIRVGAPNVTFDF